MKTQMRLMVAVVAVVALSACTLRLSHVDKGFRSFQKAQACVDNQIKAKQVVDTTSCPDYARAEAEFKAALEDDEDNPYAQLNLGAVYHNTGRQGLAIPLYEKVLVTGKDIRPSRKANAEKAEQQKQNPSLAELAQTNLDLLRGVVK